MIQFDPHCFLIRSEDGCFLPLDIRQFAREVWNQLQQNHADLPPDIETSLVESLFDFLSDRPAEEPITIGYLCKLISKILNDYDNLKSPRKRVFELDLNSIVQENGLVFELGFFSKLNQIFHFSPQPSSSLQVNLKGIKDCAKRLSSRRRWCPSSSRLRDEIVNYVRVQASAHSTHDLLIKII